MKWAAIIAVLTIAVLWFFWQGPPATSTAADQTAASLVHGEPDSMLTTKVDPAINVGAELVEDNNTKEADEVLRIDEVRTIQFITPAGDPILGETECYFLENNEILYERMQTFSRLGDYLWGDSIVFEGFSNSNTGKLTLGSTPKADFFIAFAEGYEPYLQAWKPLLPGETLEIQLEPVDAIKVRVLDRDGNPIEDGEVWISYRGTFNHSNQADDLARLRQRFFQFGYLTEKDGTVELLTCFEGAHNEVLFMPGQDWGNENYLIKSRRMYNEYPGEIQTYKTSENKGKL